MAGGVLGGLLVLFVSFWVAYGVIWFISHSVFPLSHRAILLVAGGFMTLVVIVGARQNWQNLDPLEQQVRLAEQMDVTLTPFTPWNRSGMSLDTNPVKASAFKIRSVASTINCILCGGVLLLLGSLPRLRRFQRLRRIDVAGCRPGYRPPARGSAATVLCRDCGRSCPDLIR